MKIIKYFTKNQYGQDREFVHDDNKNDALLISHLTGQKTITPSIRRLIESLTDGEVKFEEVLNK